MIVEKMNLEADYVKLIRLKNLILGWDCWIKFGDRQMYQDVQR